MNNAIGIAIIIIVLGASIWFSKCQWDECRDADLSVFYCIKHIG